MSPPLASCKPWRLCQFVDASLVLRRPHLTAIEYLEIARTLELDHAGAYQSVPQIPREAGAFIECLMALHSEIFSTGEPAIAGRLRSAPVEFGGDASHRLVGCEPVRIPAALAEVAGKLPSPEVTRGMSLEAFAEQCALFLERFFRVHPFVDGNGRVGRLVLESLAVHETKFGFIPFDTTPKGRRRYVKALQFAHKFARESVHPETRRHHDPMRHLRKFIADHLIEITDDDALEPESS